MIKKVFESFEEWQECLFPQLVQQEKTDSFNIPSDELAETIAQMHMESILRSVIAED